MDIREFALWIKEAKFRALVKRSESYAAALLPYREAEKVNAEIKRLEAQFFETAHEEEIEAAERDMREHLAKLKKQGRK